MDDLSLQGKLKIFTDGASRGNPGPASVGIVFYDEKDHALGDHKEYLGEYTNNFAEYMAVIRALEICTSHPVKEIDFLCDSQLLVRQMSGEYKVKSEQIIPLYEQVKKLVRKFGRVDFHHVRRELNKEADALANQALDSAIM